MAEGSMEALVQCEWRLFLVEGCPYVSDLIMVHQVAYYFYWWSAAVLVYLIFVRTVLFRYPLLRSGEVVWYLRLDPTHLFTFASLFNLLARAVQITLLLYHQDVTPLFVRNLLLSVGHVVLMISGVYLWMNVVSFLPAKNFFNPQYPLQRVIFLNSVAAVGISFLLFATLWLDATSGHYTLDNLPLSNALITVAYSIWTISTYFFSFSTLYHGVNLLREMKSVIDFPRESHTVQERFDTQKSYAILRALIFFMVLFPFLAGTIILVVNVARYAMFASRGFSVAFCVLFTFNSGSICLVCPSYLFARDVWFRYKEAAYERQKEEERRRSRATLTERMELSTATPLGERAIDEFMKTIW